jgi:hypothetical protein
MRVCVCVCGAQIFENFQTCHGSIGLVLLFSAQLTSKYIGWCVPS